MRWSHLCRAVLALALGCGASTSHCLAAEDSAPLVNVIRAADPLDWPTWRGPEQNGISRETGLPDRWDPEGENLLWKSEELATRSTPIVLGGKLYTLARSEPGTKTEGEKVICADAATGKLIWETKFNVFLSDVPDTRVAWGYVTSDPSTGKIYAQGVCGYLLCLDGETGQILWSRSLSEEFGLVSTYGGRTNTPVIFDDLVIVSAVMVNWGEQARPAHRFLGLDKATGEVRWFNGTTPLPTDTTYSVPFLGMINGEAAMVFGSGDGRYWAFQPRTGVPIWSYRLSARGINLSPIMDGNTVYAGQSEENVGDNTMGAMAAIDAASGRGELAEDTAIWNIRERLMIGKSSPVLVDGFLYCADDSGGFYKVDAQTGEIAYRTRLTGTIMRASLLYADGKIYAPTTSVWHVIDITGRTPRIAHRLRLDLSQGEEVHGSPIISHGRIYLPTTLAMYCIGNPDAMTGADPLPPLPEESPVSDDPRPAHVQLVPAESLVKPGQQVQYRVRLFNARGQLLEESPAEFSVDANGQVTSAGLYVADSSAAHAASMVTAQVGELASTARVRIVPELPWQFDFENGDIPISWLGIRYRHVTRELEDGNTVMVKITTIPLGTRSQGWMGWTGLHDYTIQADVQGKTANNKMPDVGLIAQRYTLDLMGNSQQVQIRSWTSQLERFSVTVPFAWKPDVWYRMKFQASTDGQQAILRGKVWERDQPEPEQWTLEGVDVAGNVVGSPGLFGQSSDAEIFIDNVSVTPN